MKFKLNGPTEAEATRVKNVELAHPKSEPAQAPNAPTQTESDEIQVSDRGATVQKPVERSSSLPGIRQDKVDAVRARIDSGSYYPSAMEIVDGMIKRERIRRDYLTGHVEPELVIATGY
jgi:flagellar biosynthesis anti-sigma factor FlgM